LNSEYTLVPGREHRIAQGFSALGLNEIIGVTSAGNVCRSKNSR